MEFYDLVLASRYAVEAAFGMTIALIAWLLLASAFNCLSCMPDAHSITGICMPDKADWIHRSCVSTGSRAHYPISVRLLQCLVAKAESLQRDPSLSHTIPERPAGTVKSEAAPAQRSVALLGELVALAPFGKHKQANSLF